ncbi:hypothetical protein CMI41_03990 [Candidatus Pacearchaeota archaeon]|jgi:MtN3 and saliva related transmembrane protein|nr:hypothetical protein [Candidatus Pacearchaeota archaeon]|tara:strand:+ start:1234 stop:1488 length:255 start_codon:yes stop_codon:yes gene_type:complete
MFPEIIGYLGGVLLILSFLPQIIQSARTKSVEDINLYLVLLTFLGTLFWVAYGVSINNLPIILMQTIFALLVFTELCLKIIYSR